MSVKPLNSSRSIGNSFDLWQEFIKDRIGLKLEQEKLDDRPFDANISIADIGSIKATTLSTVGLKTIVSDSALKEQNRENSIFIRIQMSGRTTTVVYGREIFQYAGQVVIGANRSHFHISDHMSEIVLLELPGGSFERILGHTNRNEFLKLDSKNPAVQIFTSFIRNLIEAHKELDRVSANRMSDIAADLILVSIASNFASTSQVDYSTCSIAQRAQIYIELNLRDKTLSPKQVASALGISLRQVQTIFEQRNTSISDWIWQRRTDLVANFLDDTKLGHVSIGTLAYDCGFTSQAHFSRRFKEQFGLTPREYRYRNRLITTDRTPFPAKLIYDEIK